MNKHLLGIVLVTISATAYSLAGYFTRLIPLDVWTMLFWRGLFAGLMIAAYIGWRDGRGALRAITAIGWPGLATAVLSTVATFMFLTAFRLTSVADVVVIMATAPFFTAGIGWLWLGEKESPSTLLASLGALLGVGIMMGGAFGEGHLLGDVLAFGTTICMALVMLIIRWRRDTPMLPAASLSAFLCPLLAFPLAAPLHVGGQDMVYLLLFGTVQFGLGLIFLTLGGRLVSATETALINTIETPMAAVWVWLAFNEIPSTPSLIGGAVVLAAVCAHVGLSLPVRPRRADAASPNQVGVRATR